jgi:DNA helicase-2/ATP-dependent DNA helicase PcrA
MQQLVITYAEVRRLYGREEYHRPSRFLRELPEHFLDEVRVKARFSPVASSTGRTPISRQSFAAEEAGIALGQNVNHVKFGQGVVLAVEGSGAHTRVQVKFKDEGVKWLVLAYANLEMIF